MATSAPPGFSRCPSPITRNSVTIKAIAQLCAAANSSPQLPARCQDSNDRAGERERQLSQLVPSGVSGLILQEENQNGHPKNDHAGRCLRRRRNIARLGSKRYTVQRNATRGLQRTGRDAKLSDGVAPQATPPVVAVVGPIRTRRRPEAQKTRARFLVMKMVMRPTACRQRITKGQVKCQATRRSALTLAHCQT